MDILTFCATKDDPRTYFHKPFNCNGLTIATNGFIILGTKLNKKYDGELVENQKKAAEILTASLKDHDYSIFTPMIDTPPDIMHVCTLCRGEGCLSEIECLECEGAGELEFGNKYSDYQVECDSCHGKGKTKTIGTGIQCTLCNGSKEIINTDLNFTDLGEGLAKIETLRKVNTLEEVSFKKCKDLKFMFKSKEGVGLFAAFTK